MKIFISDRRNARWCILLFLFLAVIIAGCQQAQEISTTTTSTTTTTTTSTTTTLAGENYFPHAGGNTWFYISSDGSSQITTVEGTAFVGSLPTQIFKTLYISPSDIKTTSEAYFRVTSSGAYYYGLPGWTTTEGYVYLSFPLEVGKSWIFYSIASSSIMANVVAHEDLMVPAGTFECYKVIFTTMNGSVETGSSNIWFGNNAGMVKMTSSYSTVETVLQWKNI